jgi:hypothetical protein
MFNWWQRSGYQAAAPAPNYTSHSDNSEGGYTVGVNEDGDTMLSMHCDSTTVTTRLNAAAVRRMIRLLQATIALEDEE